MTKRHVILFAAFAFFVGCNSQRPIAQSDSVSISRPESSQSVDLNETKLIAVKVTGMMCPHSCLKDVKTLISKANDVESIELTPQKEAEVIDNPVVMVRYRGVMDREATSKSILAAGFEKVEFTEQ